MARPLAPGASARGELGVTGDVDRYTIVVPRQARSLTYDVDVEPLAASIAVQVWHRGRIVDEAYGEALGGPRTIGVRPGQRYGFVLSRRAGAARLSYEVSVEVGEEAWEIEPNHVEGAANGLGMGRPLRGHLDDDDRFVLRPGAGVRRVAVDLSISDGAAWLAVVHADGEAFAPRVVQGRHREVFDVQEDRPLTVLLRPLVGQPSYRLRADARSTSLPTVR